MVVEPVTMIRCVEASSLDVEGSRGTVLRENLFFPSLMAGLAAPHPALAAEPLLLHRWMPVLVAVAVARGSRVQLERCSTASRSGRASKLLASASDNVLRSDNVVYTR